MSNSVNLVSPASPSNVISSTANSAKAEEKKVGSSHEEVATSKAEGKQAVSKFDTARKVLTALLVMGLTFAAFIGPMLLGAGGIVMAVGIMAIGCIVAGGLGGAVMGIMKIVRDKNAVAETENASFRPSEIVADRGEAPLTVRSEGGDLALAPALPPPGDPSVAKRASDSQLSPPQAQVLPSSQTREAERIGAPVVPQTDQQQAKALIDFIDQLIANARGWETTAGGQNPLKETAGEVIEKLEAMKVKLEPLLSLNTAPQGLETKGIMDECKRELEKINNNMMDRDASMRQTLTRTLRTISGN